MSAWLISIRPRFVKDIFSGMKSVELRRQRIQAKPGDLLFVYETSPVMAIMGFVVVVAVETRQVNSLWPRVRSYSGVTRREYAEYFTGVDQASAIHLAQPTLLDEPIVLSNMREVSPAFHPPRTWTSFRALPLTLQNLIVDRCDTSGVVFPFATPLQSIKRPFDLIT